MRKSWPFTVAVVAVGVVAGAAIAGRPTAVDSFKLPAPVTSPVSVSTPIDAATTTP
jgi:hypothetical protein